MPPLFILAVFGIFLASLSGNSLNDRILSAPGMNLQCENGVCVFSRFPLSSNQLSPAEMSLAEYLGMDPAQSVAWDSTHFWSTLSDALPPSTQGAAPDWSMDSWPDFEALSRVSSPLTHSPPLAYAPPLNAESSHADVGFPYRHLVVEDQHQGTPNSGNIPNVYLQMAYYFDRRLNHLMDILERNSANNNAGSSPNDASVSVEGGQSVSVLLTRIIATLVFCAVFCRLVDIYDQWSADRARTQADELGRGPAPKPPARIL